MALPVVALPTETIEVNGESITIRGLSRGEVIQIGTVGAKDMVEGECLALAAALGAPIDDVRAWYATAPFPVVQLLAGKIAELSGLDNLGEGLSGASRLKKSTPSTSS